MCGAAHIWAMDSQRTLGAGGGSYANYFRVGHNGFEFVVEFGQSYEEDAQVHTRVIVSPVSAKLLLSTLAESISQYQAEFGQIPEAC